MSNKYGKDTNFQGKTPLAKFSETEKTTKNSTNSVSKQPEDWAQKPIQPEAKGRTKKCIPHSVKEWLIYLSTLNISEIHEMANSDMIGDHALALSIYRNALKGDKYAINTVLDNIGNINAKEYVESNLQNEDIKSEIARRDTKIEAEEREEAEIRQNLKRFLKEQYDKTLNQKSKFMQEKDVNDEEN